jgi:hypothetical protein
MGPETSTIEPRQDLPASYVKIWNLDLTTNQRAAVILNIAAFPLFLVFGSIFVKIAVILGPETINRINFVQLASHQVVSFIVILIVVLGVMILHEAIHGAFFWIFTKSKPIFGLKLLFAYAGAPQWYIPRNQYALIGIAPFLFITLIGFVVIYFSPLPAGQLALFAITMNAAGAVGDFYVCGKTLLQPPDILINDTGVGFTMYAKHVQNVEMQDQRAKGVITHER